MNTSALAFLSSEFYDKKKTVQLILPAVKKKKKKKNSRGRKRSRSGESSCTPLRPETYALIQCATLTLTLSARYFKALTFQAVIRYKSFELFCFCKIDFFSLKKRCLTRFLSAFTSCLMTILYV